MRPKIIASPAITLSASVHLEFTDHGLMAVTNNANSEEFDGWVFSGGRTWVTRLKDISNLAVRMCWRPAPRDHATIRHFHERAT